MKKTSATFKKRKTPVFLNFNPLTGLSSHTVLAPVELIWLEIKTCWMYMAEMKKKGILGMKAIHKFLLLLLPKINEERRFMLKLYR